MSRDNHLGDKTKKKSKDMMNLKVTIVISLAGGIRYTKGWPSSTTWPGEWL